MTRSSPSRRQRLLQKKQQEQIFVSSAANSSLRAVEGIDSRGTCFMRPPTRAIISRPDMSIDIGAVAQQGFLSTDPRDRLASIQCAILECASIAAGAGARITSVHEAVRGVQLLMEAGDGNFSNRMWPKNRKRGRSRPSFDVSCALGALMASIKIRHTRPLRAPSTHRSHLTQPHLAKGSRRRCPAPPPATRA
jgi:hypothetical protein